jgi:ribosomal protein S18 acetylase RimI-like enzyme
MDLRQLIKANWSDFYTRLGRAPGADLSVGPHLSWLLTGVPDHFLNVVFRTDIPAVHADKILEDALSHFRASNCSRLSWWVDGPDSDVGRRLAARGLTFAAGATAMAADLGAVPDVVTVPAGIVIAPVDDEATLRGWIRVMRTGFGLPETAEPRLFEVFSAVALQPPFRTYLATLDGEAVATSQLFIGAGVAGVYNVTCLPEARGRGIGAAITHAALREARRQGVSLGILQASDLGYGVYRRLGFEDCGRLNVYLLG